MPKESASKSSSSAATQPTATSTITANADPPAPVEEPVSSISHDADPIVELSEELAQSDASVANSRTPKKRGANRDWVTIINFNSPEEIADQIDSSEWSKVKHNTTIYSLKTYYQCKVPNCPKMLRVTQYHTNRISAYSRVSEPLEASTQGILEEIEDQVHDHTNSESGVYGLSKFQKQIVLECIERNQCQPKKILAEFRRLENGTPESEANTPSLKQITNFCAYYRRKIREGLV